MPAEWHLAGIALSEVSLMGKVISPKLLSMIGATALYSLQGRCDPLQPSPDTYFPVGHDTLSLRAQTPYLYILATLVDSLEARVPLWL